MSNGNTAQAVRLTPYAHRYARTDNAEQTKANHVSKTELTSEQTDLNSIQPKRQESQNYHELGAKTGQHTKAGSQERDPNKQHTDLPPKKHNRHKNYSENANNPSFFYNKNKK